jgi:DNA-binding transcriptional LysR family regulator
MRHVLAVARGGSMSEAARQLGVNHATVIRRVRSLEQQLGTSLFDRVGYNYVITPAGQVALDAAEAMEAQFSLMERQVVGQVTELRGTIRVTAPEAMARDYLVPGLKQFRDIYPEILIELSLSMRPYDLGLREADVAFRVTENPPQDVVGKRLGGLAAAVYCPSAAPLRREEVREVVALINTDGSPPEWVQAYFPEATVTLASDSPSALTAAVKEGFGVALLVCAVADLDPELQRIAGLQVQMGPSVWLLTHVDVRTNARLRVFRDFMQEFMMQRFDLVEGRTAGAWAAPTEL